MDFNSSGYFAYKKNKIQREIAEQKKPISRINFLFQLFVATFIIMFIVIVFSIMKFSSKMDIEYTKGELQLANGTINNISNYGQAAEEETQRKIDKRLILIQQEENAPSEAKVLNKNTNPQVIDPSHIEQNKKLEKQERLEKQKALNSKSSSKITNIFEEVKQKKNSNDLLNPNSNVTIMSKVLVGRYNTFEEAQKLQNDIKSHNPKMQPFVQKIGNVFSVQMGSFQDFNIAKSFAQDLKNHGLDVWIYQQ